MRICLFSAVSVILGMIWGEAREQKNGSYKTFPVSHYKLYMNTCRFLVDSVV